jgi:dipeptidyl aminopeptidase/acylaminoacyl peptidase
VNVDTGERDVVPGARDGAWSPDGKWLAYDRIDQVAPGAGGQPPEHVSALWVSAADGSQPRKLLDMGTPSQAALLVADWSPDGKYVLHWIDPYFSGSFLADGARLMAVPLAGGQPVEVVDKMLVSPDVLHWAADGQRLAVADGGRRMAWETRRSRALPLAAGRGGSPNRPTLLFSRRGLRMAAGSRTAADPRRRALAVVTTPGVPSICVASG